MSLLEYPTCYNLASSLNPLDQVNLAPMFINHNILWQCHAQYLIYNREYKMSFIDHYSRYPEIEIINSTASKIVCLQIIGENILQFCCSFCCRPIDKGSDTNGTVERLTQPLMKAIKAPHIENKNWHLELFKFLRSHRALPHPSTGKSP